MRLVPSLACYPVVVSVQSMKFTFYGQSEMGRDNYLWSDYGVLPVRN